MNDASMSATEALLIKLAREYINLPLEKADELIQLSLQEMAEFVSADRAYVFRYDLDRMQCSNTHEWCAEGISAEIDNLQDVDITNIPDWINAHALGNDLYIPDVFELPEDNGVRQILEPQGVKSLITVPMLHNNTLIGFIGFDSVRYHHVYTTKELKLLSLYAEMLVNLGMRKEATAKLEAERLRAEHANKAKSQFLANMSHELRTPLNAIVGFTELLSETKLNPQQIEYTETIHHASQLLFAIVNDILDFSKIEAGKLSIEDNVVSLPKVVEKTLKIFQEKAKGKGVLLSCELDTQGHDEVVTDELRLTQVLINLLNNAVKFTYTGEIKLIIRCTSSTQRYVGYFFSVEDSGIGMEQGLVERLFRPFEQADSSTARVFGGTGLGLAISQRIINALGGKIEVESQPGKGSNFFFNLTLQKNISTHVEQQNTLLGEALPLLQKKILIAEDVRLNRQLMKQMLKDSGCEITFAENGQEAVDIALGNEFDIVIMDLQMPIMDGFEASKRILANKPSLKIVALSAAASEIDVQRTTDAGILRHLAKPIRKHDLYATLHDVLNNS